MDSSGKPSALVEAKIALLEVAKATQPKRFPLSPLAAIVDESWVTREWALDLLAAALIGGLMGIVAFPYMELVSKVPLWWATQTGAPGFPNNPSAITFGAGSSWCVLICGFGGTVVGVLKASLGLDTFPSFITEVKQQHGEPRVCAKLFICCAVSLCAGATLGPEAGLGGLGAAAGHFAMLGMAHLFPWMSQDEIEVDFRRRAYILCGVASAFGATFPSPFSAIILVGEIASAGTDQSQREILGQHRLSRKATALLVPSATVAFGVRYGLAPVEEFSHPGEVLPYSNWWILISVGLAIVAAAVGLFFIVVTELMRLLVFKLGGCIERCVGKSARIIFITSITGALIGWIISYFPLCLGSGFDMMRPTMENAPDLSGQVLLFTCIAKCVTLALSHAGGFVGGLFFPLMYIGVLAGEACAQILHTPNRLTCFIMMSAVPGSVITAPLAMVALPMGMFIMNPLQSVPLFLAVVISNNLLVGTGVLQRVLRAKPDDVLALQPTPARRANYQFWSTVRNTGEIEV